MLAMVFSLHVCCVSVAGAGVSVTAHTCVQRDMAGLLSFSALLLSGLLLLLLLSVCQVTASKPTSMSPVMYLASTHHGLQCTECTLRFLQLVGRWDLNQLTDLTPPTVTFTADVATWAVISAYVCQHNTNTPQNLKRLGSQKHQNRAELTKFDQHLRGRECCFQSKVCRHSTC